MVITASIVASPGASMPTPLIMPPMVQPFSPVPTVRTSSLETVSVVMMAVAASVPARGVSARARAATSIPSRRTGMSMRSPMTPVEQTRTWPGSVLSSPAARAAVASVSRRPCSPVQALALPELRTTARAWPGRPPS